MPKTQTYFLLCSLIVTDLTACSSTPDPVTASIAQYQGYDCQQIQAEMQRISGSLEETNKNGLADKAMDTAMGMFAMSQRMAYVSSSSKGSDAQLRAEYDALSQLSIQKHCFNKP